VLRILLQRFKKSVHNHTKMQLQQNAQQAWLQVTHNYDDALLIAGVLL